MASITVNSAAQAMVVVAQVMARMRDESAQRELLRATEKEVARVHVEVWDRGLGTHARDTVEDRRTRAKGTYYAKVSPNGRARPAHPYLEWSGALRDAAGKLTRLGRGRAEIDADQNYRGPIRSRTAFSQAVLRRVPEARIYPMGLIERGVERSVLEQWVTRTVLPFALRRGV